MALIYAVEDDKNILEIEMFALKNSGYQVDGFECARDFYKKLDERQPDLVLLDIMLPDEDGLEIVGKLRRRPETKKLPVIMVTAKTTEIDKVKGLDVGADDYLTKPFGVMELIARVKAVLRRTIEEEKFLSLGELLNCLRIIGRDSLIIFRGFCLCFIILSLFSGFDRLFHVIPDFLLIPAGPCLTVMTYEDWLPTLKCFCNLI